MYKFPESWSCADFIFHIMQFWIWTEATEKSFANPTHTVVWKNEKIFREINSLVISFVNPLLSRNFCQKSSRANFRKITWIEVKIIFDNSKEKNVDFTKFLLYLLNSSKCLCKSTYISLLDFFGLELLRFG